MNSHQNPYESFPESVVINASKASSDSLHRPQHFYYSAGSRQEPPINENSQSYEILDFAHNQNDTNSIIHNSDL